MNNLGLTYKKMKLYQKSEEHYLKSLQIKQAVLQKDHPDINLVKYNLGQLYLDMGQQAKA